MTVATQLFARDFAAARTRFREAVTRAGGNCREYAHPLAGPDGSALSSDVVRFGADDAEKMLVLITGVHGVEHYAGSACLADWLDGGGGSRVPSGMAVLLVHAINPWGAAWCRRYNEDNVDLARNFVNFGEPLPEHPAYEAVHAAISSEDRAALPALLDDLYARLGERDTIETLMSGQYRHPDGFSFGGHAPVWSRRTIENILTEHCGNARSAAIVEYHSGLGPWGVGAPVTMQTGGDLERVHRFYGPEIIAPRVNGGSHSAVGHTTDGYVRALPGKQITSIVLEFGTYPPDRSLPVLLDDHWLHLHGDQTSPLATDIRAENLEMHCPDDAEWQAMVMARSGEIIAQSLKGLAQCS